MSLTATKVQNVIGTINESGRVVIPAALRRQMGVTAGDAVLMEVEDGVLRIESHRARMRRIQDEFKQFSKPGVRMSDQLIADRREEARREMEQGLG